MISVLLPFLRPFRAHFTLRPGTKPVGFSSREGVQMILLFDPYANPSFSMSDIRLVNRVADELFLAHDELDLRRLSHAIRSAYRPGMHPHALKTHVERDLQLGAGRGRVV
jgi:hypothetical protein